ncbi:polyphosphate kinase 1 [Spirochaeta dissipatitropha]
MSQQFSFVNRELSWLEFNRRVLQEALREDLPLLERLKFLCIVTSNFDEFFMVRVAAIKRQRDNENYTICPSGISPQELLNRISSEVRSLLEEQYSCLIDRVLPALAENNLILRKPGEFSPEQESAVRQRFQQEIYPLLTPVRMEPERPLPYLGNLNLYAAFKLTHEDGEPLYGEPKGEHFLAIVPIPSGLPRIWYLPSAEGTTEFTMLEDVIRYHAHILFPGYRIDDRVLFRITRDADMGVDEERDEDFVEAMEQVLAWRDRSQAIRLSVDEKNSPVTPILQEHLDLEDGDVFFKPNPIDINPLFELAELPGFENLMIEKWRPVDHPKLGPDRNIWEVLKNEDILLHHPYQSFEPVIRLLTLASEDPQVLAIKMTLYRTSGNSPVVKALERAAINGKQVTVLVELKARFDEERNISWAERLERAGALVVYGIARLKVHAKAILVIRREENGIVRYFHAGTGNYNDKTARAYTDMGLMSSKLELSYDVGQFFNAITGYSAIPALKRLVMAPIKMKHTLLQLIEREAQRSTRETPGRIIAKLNSIADPEIITALYEASRQHVQIDLNVRGICMLVPGVPGQSENIRVCSVIDRYLEHTRAFYFLNGGSSEVYISSADWMSRNLERRVELMIPIDDRGLREEVIEILELYLKDTSNSHRMLSDGSYERIQPLANSKARQVQKRLYRMFKTEGASGRDREKEFPVRKKPL